MPATTSIAEIRKKYPEYNDLSDQQIADGMHAKFYADMPKEEFYKRVGFAGAGDTDLTDPMHFVQTSEGLLKDAQPLADIMAMQMDRGQAAPIVRPSLAERLSAHFGAGVDEGTVLGAASAAGGGVNSAAAQRYGADTPANAEAATLRQVEANRNAAALRAMPDAETLPEYGAAIAGEVAGQLTDPTNLLGLPVKGGQAVYRGMRALANPKVSRIITRGVQVAAPNLALDPTIQGFRVQGGQQSEYEPWRTAIGTLTGFGIGAGASTMAQLVAKLRSSAGARTGKGPEKVMPGDLTPDDLFSDDVLRILDANNAVTPEQRMAFGQQVERRLAEREAAAQAQREAVVAQTVGTPGEVRVDLPSGADVQAALQPAPEVIQLGNQAIGAGETGQVQGNVAGEQLRGKFQAPAVVEPQAAPMTDEAVAIAQRQLQGGNAGVEGDKLVVPPGGAPRSTQFGAPLQVARGMTDEEIALAQAAAERGRGPGVEGDKLYGQESRAPQTGDQAEGQREAGQAFDLAAAQRERLDDTPGSLDTQAAGRPQGVDAAQVVLDDGFPVVIEGRRIVPDGRGRMVEVARVRRFDPRTGQVEADAVPYEVPVRELRASRYAQEPRQAQDFQERAAGPRTPETPRMADEGVRQEPQQTYRATRGDPNEDFPGAGSGRSPFPEQPDGPFPGRQRPRNEEEAIRDFEARQKAGEKADAEAGARYKEGQFSTKAKGQGDDKAWHVDETGFVLSDKGGPVRFADQKQAAKWILNVGHKDSPQTFEIANHPSGKGFTVRERGRTKPDESGSARAGDQAPGSTAAPAEGTPSPTRALPPPGSGEKPDVTPASKPGQKPAAGAKSQPKGKASEAPAKEAPAPAAAARAAPQEKAAPFEVDQPGGEFAGVTAVELDKRLRTAQAKKDKTAETAIIQEQLRRRNMENAKIPKQEGENFRAEDDRAAGFQDPDAKPGRGDGAPRTQAQLEGQLNRADADRAEPDLTKAQKGEAAAAKEKSVGAIKAAADQPEAQWANQERAARKEAADLYVAGKGRGTGGALFAEGWKAAAENRRTPYGDAADAGAKAYGKWLAENPKPDKIPVTLQTARGQETKVELEPDADQITKFAERVNKLPIGRFYSNPLDPELFKELFGPLFGKEAARWRDELAEIWADLKGFDGSSIRRGAGDLGRTLFFSNDGILRSLAHRFPEANGEPNRAIEHIANMFFAPVGDVEKTGVGRTYGEAVERRVQASINQLTDLLRPFESYSLKDQRAVLEQISRLIVNGKVQDNGSQVHGIAREIQKVLKDWLAYAREAGVEIGDQGPRYFPRELATDRIFANPKGFLQKAAEAYRADGADGAEAEQLAAAWLRRIQESDLGFRSDGNDFVNTGTGRTPKNERARQLSPAADKILDDYYLRNVADVLPQYFLRMARRAEWVRRMGADLEKWKELRQAIQDSGAGEAIPDVVRTIQSMTGSTSAPIGTGRRALISALKVAGIATYLPRAVLSSLSEPIVIASRSGNAGDAVRAIGTTLNDMMREITGMAVPSKRAEAAREIAEDLGLVAQIGDDMLMAQRFGGRVENKLARRITNQFFVRTGLHHFTEATRVAATSIGQTFLRRLSRSIEKDGIYSQSSRFLLGELGIKDVDGFAHWVNQFDNGIPRPDQLAGDTGKEAEAYKDALYRFVSQSILKPGAEVKARYANHPIGSLFYHLQSYNYAFQKNVLNRFGRLGVAAFRGKGMNVADRLRLMAPLAWFSSIAIPMQYGIGKLRDIYQDDPGVDPELKKRGVDEQALRAVSRAGLGMMDLPLNIATGIKYSRDPATVAAGPIFGGLLEALKAGVELYGKDNSPNTNTAERRAMKYVYEVIMKPIMNSALSLAPGKLGAALSIPGIQYVSLPSTRDKVVTAAAGKPPFAQGRASSRAGGRGSSRVSSR